MKTSTGLNSFDLIMDQIAKIQAYGRKGEMLNARACLDAAKDIFNKTKGCDDQVKANIDFFTNNFANFTKLIGK